MITSMAVDLDMCTDEFIEQNVWDDANDGWRAPKSTLAPTMARRAQEYLCIPCRNHLNADMIEDHVAHARHQSKATWRRSELEKMNSPAMSVMIPPPSEGRRIPPKPPSPPRSRSVRAIAPPPPRRHQEFDRSRSPIVRKDGHKKDGREQGHVKTSLRPPLPLRLSTEEQGGDEPVEDNEFLLRQPIMFYKEGAFHTAAKSAGPPPPAMQWRDFIPQASWNNPTHEPAQLMPPAPPPIPPEPQGNQELALVPADQSVPPWQEKAATNYAIKRELPQAVPPSQQAQEQPSSASSSSSHGLVAMVHQAQQAFPGSVIMIVTPPSAGTVWPNMRPEFMQQPIQVVQTPMPFPVPVHMNVQPQQQMMSFAQPRMQMGPMFQGPSSQYYW